jgi:hypothetical protein
MRTRIHTFGIAHILVISSLVIAGVYLGVQSYQEWVIRNTLRETGKVVDGMIVSKQDIKTEGAHFYVTYAFNVETSSGQSSPKIDKEEVSAQQYRSLQVGDIIIVRLDPDSPNIYRTELNDKIYWLYAAFAAAFIGLAAVSIIGYQVTRYEFRTIFHKED